jgi:hypothetical protein
LHLALGNDIAHLHAQYALGDDALFVVRFHHLSVHVEVAVADLGGHMFGSVFAEALNLVLVGECGDADASTPWTFHSPLVGVQIPKDDCELFGDILANFDYACERGFVKLQDKVSRAKYSASIDVLG